MEDVTGLFAFLWPPHSSFLRNHFTFDQHSIGSFFNEARPHKLVNIFARFVRPKEPVVPGRLEDFMVGHKQQRSLLKH